MHIVVICTLLTSIFFCLFVLLDRQTRSDASRGPAQSNDGLYYSSRIS